MTGETISLAKVTSQQRSNILTARSGEFIVFWRRLADECLQETLAGFRPIRLLREVPAAMTLLVEYNFHAVIHRK
ncbi:MAG: hypothetical protein JSS24_04420 [Proteobacteria bacterium]|nr:hypothetical protein [Pseudomonadota bacterium]